MAESNFDYFGGGMVRIDKTPAGEKSAHDIMKERGFVIASDREQFNAMKPEAEKQYYAYNTGFAANALDYTIDMDSSAITLAEFTQKGIELLDNDKGFFMMVEGGKSTGHVMPTMPPRRFTTPLPLTRRYRRPLISTTAIPMKPSLS